MTDWMDQERHLLTERMATRKRKARHLTDWREKKSCAHRTVNGRGVVARLARAK